MERDMETHKDEQQQREAFSAVCLGSPQWIPAVGCDGDENREAEEEHGDDLDFAFMPRDLVSGQEITADEIFSDGRNGNREAKEEHGDDSGFTFVPRDLVSGEEITADESSIHSVRNEERDREMDSHNEEQRDAISAVRLGSPQWIPADEISSNGRNGNREAEEEHGDDLDFAFMPRDLVSGEDITADEIFSDGRIRTAFPLFGREVVIPMQGLAIKDRDGVAESASSSECDELEGVPDKSYCVWAPERQVRSNSWGESRRLRIRDILQGRSRSDGNKRFLFLTPPPPPPPVAEKEIPKGGNEKKGKAVKVTEMDIVTAHRLYYSKKSDEAVKGGRRSFLPYRPDLVGFFGGAANRTHKPF